MNFSGQEKLEKKANHQKFISKAKQRNNEVNIRGKTLNFITLKETEPAFIATSLLYSVLVIKPNLWPVHYLD